MVVGGRTVNGIARWLDRFGQSGPVAASINGGAKSQSASDRASTSGFSAPKVAPVGRPPKPPLPGAKEWLTRPQLGGIVWSLFYYILWSTTSSDPIAWGLRD